MGEGDREAVEGASKPDVVELMATFDWLPAMNVNR